MVAVMEVSDMFYWIGVAHVVAYAFAGGVTLIALATAKFLDWAVKRFKLKADIVRAIKIVWDERREKKEGPFYGA